MQRFEHGPAHRTHRTHPTRRTLWPVFLLALIVLALALTACGEDEKNDQEGPSPQGGDVTSNSLPEATPTPDSAGPNLETGITVSGPDVSGQGEGGSEIGTDLPGCSNLEGENCPAPLDAPLDGEAAGGGVSIAFPDRYFDAATQAEGILIEITPSELNRFEFEGTFQVYFAESLDAALAELVDPETKEWDTGTLNGIIGVSHDETQDPLVTTAIGAFELADGRVVVLKAITTGKYGWYFHTTLYEAMLNSLVVEGEKSGT